MERHAALDLLPLPYACALRMLDEGAGPDAVADALHLEPEAVGPFLRLARDKLALLCAQEDPASRD